MIPYPQFFSAAIGLLFFCSSLHALDSSGLDSIPIQEGGRKKPFLVFADEALLSLSGKGRFSKNGEKLSATETVASLWLAPTGWEDQPILLIGNKKFKDDLGLDPAKKLFTYRELAANEKLRDALQEVSSIRSKNPKASLDVLQREASTVGMRLAVFEGLVSGRSVTLLPTGAAAWSPLKSDDAALAKLREGFRSNNQGDFDAGLAELRVEQAREEARFQANASKIALEVFYQRLHPFRWAWILYLAAGIGLLLIPGKGGYALGWAASSSKSQALHSARSFLAARL